MRFACTASVVFVFAAMAAPVAAGMAGDGLLARWILTQNNVVNGTLRAEPRTYDASVEGHVRFAGESGYAFLNGTTNRVQVAQDPRGLALPKESFSVEAWASIDVPLEWGGIVGLFQDNGPVEQGWLLGYRNNSFCFAVSSEGADDSDGKLTYLTGDIEFVASRWYHVVGIYDGQEMRLYVNGKLRGTSREQSGPINYPAKAFFEIGAYHDDDEDFRMRGHIAEVRLYDRALTEEEVRAYGEERSDLVPEAITLALGPYLQFIAPGRAVVRWHTATALPSAVEYGTGDDIEYVEDPSAKTNHAMEISVPERNTLYQYRIVLGTGPAATRTASFECDTTFNYTLPEISKQAASDGKDVTRWAAAAEYIIRQTGITQGYCIDLGCGDGQLAIELAKRSQLRVIGVDEDASAIARARTRIHETGVYGTRVTARQVDSLETLPFTGCFANLVVSSKALLTGTCPGSAREVLRVVKPDSGVALIGWPASVQGTSGMNDLREWTKGVEGAVLREEEGSWVRIQPPPVPGSGKWTHQYGSADNSARSGESLMGATATHQFDVQWVGEPGPRAMVDRNPRCPAPLNANGRLFTQGLHRIIAQDAHNGTILWSLEIPQLERFNMPRDCANWCADERYLYVAVKDSCWQLGAQTGALEKFYRVVPPGRTSTAFEWGYVANDEETLFGSAVKMETPYTNFWGKNEAGWYDAPTGSVTHKVCSDLLFAFGKDTGEPRWTYGQGLIINASITVADGAVYLVECRNDTARANAGRRVGIPELWQDQYLVALDAVSGATRWERPIDTVDGTVVFYLLHANGKLFIALSEREYHLYAFNAADGTPLWEAGHPWTGSDHSGHMQHPAVAGNVIYLEPCGYDMDTGERVTDKVGRHEGCATYAATEGALIYRGAGRLISLWDVDTAEVTGWTRLRPSCWLSTIAGDGMILSPEGGGGCSCGNWMETSLAFIPRPE